MGLFYRVKSQISETKMKACKRTLEQIAVLGSILDVEAQSHLAECQSCTSALQEVVQLEQLLLPPPEQEVPVHLKYAILNSVRQQKKFAFFPALGFTFKMVAIFLILVSGFWLGLQMASGNYETKTGDFDVTSAEAYKTNTSPADPSNLGEVYFTVLQEE